MSTINLVDTARSLGTAWKSTIVGMAANANIKVLRMDEMAYAAETHDFAEALLVLEGCMNLEIAGNIVQVHAGHVHIVPAGLPHAVAAGSWGTLVIVDQAVQDATS
ncbi:MAG: cupin domain-containing protein [Burkholderiales bacterium]|nr:cupin domain-containing protein [Burkholderiales bacterium]